jgi:SAM-dependent methyltransferase
MQEPWQFAGSRTAEFDAGALAYDRYRPRYPDRLFDDIIELGSVAPGSTAVEIGAGTGIATGPLANRGLRVTAIEPAPAMAAVGEARTGDRVRWYVGRFEECAIGGPVDLVTSFNAWHWVEPTRVVERVADLLRPAGAVALVWTEVVSWGGAAFDDALAEAFGAPWPKTIGPVLDSRLPIADDDRFGPFVERRHRFARDLDAATFVAVTRTYGGTHSDGRDAILTRLVQDAGGTVTKVEEAVLYLARRR